MVEANSLQHGQEGDVCAGAGYQGGCERPDARDDVTLHVAMMPGYRRSLDEASPMDSLIDEAERLKASVRVEVEHPFQVAKGRFEQVTVRCRGLTKNTMRLRTVFALSNGWSSTSPARGSRRRLPGLRWCTLRLSPGIPGLP